MPTGKGNDVIPIRTATKEALRLAKGTATFDEVLQALLTDMEPEDIAACVEARRRADTRREAARRAAGQCADPGRSPEKQVLTAKTAEIARRRWLDIGRLERLGPRRYRLNVDAGGEPVEATLRIRPGRGIPPVQGEGARRFR